MNYYGKDHLHKPKKGKGSYMRQTIEIALEEFDSLKESEMRLLALENAGVDNWSGYDYAVEILQEMKEEEERCRVNTTTVDGATPQQDSSQQTEINPIDIFSLN